MISNAAYEIHTVYMWVDDTYDLTALVMALDNDVSHWNTWPEFF